MELGDNRIKEIKGIDHLVKLRQLFLGKNKIGQIKGISTLTNLKSLSIQVTFSSDPLVLKSSLSQANRLTKAENLDALVDLEELYLSDQGLETVEGLSSLVSSTSLRIVQFSCGYRRSSR